MKPVLFVLAAAAFALATLTSGSALPETAAVDRAVLFIAGTQQSDGGFGGFGDGQTFDAIFALRSAGIDPTTVRKDGKSPADFLVARAAAQANAPAAAKAALAAVALGLDPARVGSTNLLAKVKDGYDAATGRFAGDDFGQSIAILGQACLGRGVPPEALTALKGAQVADGGWGFQGTSDTDTTAIAIQALVAAGVPKTDPALTRALAYLKQTQHADGGWGFDPEASDASSTAFAVQALIALGEDPAGASYRKGTATPVSLLLARQLADGSFAGFDPAFAANQVTPALAGRTYCGAVTTPITRGLPAASPTPTSTPTTTASPTATATPTASPSPSPTASVRPASPVAPKTGLGTSAGQEAAPWAAIALLAAGAGVGLLGLAAARRR